jgi:hypothetical protein
MCCGPKQFASRNPAEPMAPPDSTDLFPNYFVIVMRCVWVPA